MTSCRGFGSLTSDTEPLRIQCGRQEHMTGHFLSVKNVYVYMMRFSVFGNSVLNEADLAVRVRCTSVEAGDQYRCPGIHIQIIIKTKAL